tara:strand:+ start:540 stop:1757 length:1218 start_codon:yes stop_codon:yes gene_type:complete
MNYILIFFGVIVLIALVSYLIGLNVKKEQKSEEKNTPEKKPNIIKEVTVKNPLTDEKFILKNTELNKYNIIMENIDILMNSGDSSNLYIPLAPLKESRDKILNEIEWFKENNTEVYNGLFNKKCEISGIINPIINFKINSKTLDKFDSSVKASEELLEKTGLNKEEAKSLFTNLFSVGESENKVDLRMYDKISKEQKSDSSNSGGLVGKMEQLAKHHKTAEGDDLKVGENKIKMIINGISPNMSSFHKSGVEIEVSEKEYIDIIEDKDNGIFEIDEDLLNTKKIIESNIPVEIEANMVFLEDGVKYYTNKELVYVWRCEVMDRKNGFLYKISELKTLNSSKKYPELNKTHYIKSPLGENFGTSIIMGTVEIKKFNEEWDYDGDNRDNGIDIYTIENFDLDLELSF